MPTLNMACNFRKLVWTEHSKIKMRQYGLSVSKLLGILHRPERKEKGIVPGTEAVMRTNPVKRQQKLPSRGEQKYSKWGSQNRAPGEIWIMYKDVTLRRGSGQEREEGNVRKIISAWRYPGVSKPGEAIPVPEDIKNEILNNNF